MTLNTKTVQMPAHKVTFKNGANGVVYVYYTIRAYRNSTGKPTSDEVAIGKKDLDTGMLIPNARYFEFFPQEQADADTPPQLNRIASCGNIIALLAIAEKTGLKKVLEKCFPDKWAQMLAVAFYMLCEGNVMMYLADWFDDTEVPFTNAIDGQRCSELFASITNDERMRFFSEWIKLRAEQEYIVYDVTSVSTYAQGIEQAEMGYNRDGEKLPQINIGMYHGATSRLPVYFTMYNGSITDKTHLTFMLDNTGKLGINNVCFVLDRGFVTQDNLDYMESKGYQFVTAFPSNRLEAYRLLDEYGALINKPAYRIHEHDLYGMTLDYACQGVKMKAHIYFDPDKKALDEKELYAHLHRLMAELKKMGKSKRITKKYTDYFKVDPEERKSLSFEVDNEKIDERIRRLGFFILLSTRLECNAAEVLTIYKGRDQIEKNFDQLKNDLDFKRLKTHLTRTTDGKLFMGFLALILRTQLLNSAKSNDAIKKLSMEKVLWELRKIKAASFADDSRIVTPLTKLQKTICSALGMTDEQLTEAFS